MRKPQIFLCHASEDKRAVIEVYKRLNDEGFNPWLDNKDLLPGQLWAEEIPKAIKTSDFALVFLSKTSVSKRGYVHKEFRIVLDVLDEMPEGRIFVIPVKLDDCIVPEKFRSLHWTNLFEPGGLDKVITSIRKYAAAVESAHNPMQVGNPIAVPIAFQGGPTIRSALTAARDPNPLLASFPLVEPPIDWKAARTAEPKGISRAKVHSSTPTGPGRERYYSSNRHGTR